jgi:hypothetical protein
MRQSEFLREKREREFYARVLGALEKPNSNRLLAIVNSAAFLWLLSALLITSGGSYFTKYQECARQADEIIDKFQRLNEELYIRRKAIFQAISDSGSIDAIRSSIKELPSIYVDLKPRTIRDLDAEFRKLNARIDHSQLDGLFTRLHVNDPTVTAQQMNMYGSIALGIVEKSWPDSGLDNLKYFASRYRVAFERGYLAVRYTEFFPSCEPSTVSKLMFSTSKPDVVQGIPNPLYVSAPVPMPE